MGNTKFTSVYVSIQDETDEYIDKLRVKKIRDDKRTYTKNDIIKYLIHKGIDVEEGKYLELDESIDEFVKQLQTMVINVDGEEVKIKKSKQQVYNMLIEKGLQNLSSD